jgi:hypothetical protein
VHEKNLAWRLSPGEEKMTDQKDIEKMEESLRTMIQSLDKGVHLETLLSEEGVWAAILSKGSHSDRAILSQDLLDGFFVRGEGEKDLRKALGKVVGKLNRMSQRRR